MQKQVMATVCEVCIDSITTCGKPQHGQPSNTIKMRASGKWITISERIRTALNFTGDQQNLLHYRPIRCFGSFHSTKMSIQAQYNKK